jgi:hypothetical protein
VSSVSTDSASQASADAQKSTSTQSTRFRLPAAMPRASWNSQRPPSQSAPSTSESKKPPASPIWAPLTKAHCW